MLGRQIPRYHSVPPYTHTPYRDEVVELIDLAGLDLFPWQHLVIEESMATREDMKTWSAIEVGLIVGRQNGKGDVIMARELAGLYIVEEKLIIHSAHETKTAHEAFTRILEVIESIPDLDAEVKKVTQGRGEEEITLKNRCRLRFMARTGGAGRGFSAPCIILDEAYALTGGQKSAIQPVMSAQPNPQIWYTSSPSLETSLEQGRIERRGQRGDDPVLCYFQWSVNPDYYDPTSPEDWADANPSMGYLIREDVIRAESLSMDPVDFARERLGLGQAPDEENAWDYIRQEDWEASHDPRSTIQGDVAFAVEVSQDRKWSAIIACGLREDGRYHVEVIDYRSGTQWLENRLQELQDKWDPVKIAVDSRGPAANTVLKASDIDTATAGDVAKAAASFFDEVMARRLFHLDDPRLTSAVANAKRRPYGDGSYYIGRKDNAYDVTPLTGACLALWAYQTREEDNMPQIW